MNVQLHKAVTDVTGKTGMAIIRAIVAGERQPEQLVRFRQGGCKLGAQEFIAALSGNFKDEHVFALRQSLAAYDFYQGQLQECDQRIEAYMAQLPSRTEPDTAPPSKRRKNQPYFDLRREQVRISGVDLTSAPGIDVLTAQTVFSEIGLEVERFPSEKNFTSWLALCPNNRKTGGRIRSSRTRRNAHRLATALRLAAQSVGRSKTALGAFYRRLAARIGAAKAITATARKLACIIYRMLKYGQPYVEQGQLAYEQAYKQRFINNIRRHAHNLGFQLLDAATGEVS
jgi:transposase